MRVLFIGTKVQPDNMEYHIVNTLEKMGHKVFGFDIKTIINCNESIDKYFNFFARTILREPERILEKKLANYAKKISPDIVIVLLGNMVSPKTIVLLKKHLDVPIVCWCQDALSTIGRQYMMGAPYDAVFLKDHYMVDLYNNMIGDRFIYLAEACNPSMHYYELPKGKDLKHYECDITTAGSLYYYRQEILKPLAAHYKLKVWGSMPDWLSYELRVRHTKEYVTGKTKRFAFSAAKIVLNTMHFAEIDGLNCRFFEILGCGGFQLVSDKSEVHKYLEVGKEVETFRDKNELIEKVDYYLKEPEKRKKIAMQGMQRAHNNHTYTHRLNELFEVTSKL
ncbi:MAG: spore maturation protein CgeB [Methyloprofundus sp.]|nr:MAG: spore maturation protein CgeB [Methyloprofundus sp.]